VRSPRARRPLSPYTPLFRSPVACAAALATLNTLDGENLAARAADLGERLRADLARALEGCAAVRDIRGQGLMIGIELDRPCADRSEEHTSELQSRENLVCRL